MSRIVTIQAEVRDPSAVAAACRRLGLREPVHGSVALYAGEAEGLLVQLPGWQFPAVVDAAAGRVLYDNYGGSWGEWAQLDRLLQMYAVEKTRIEARNRGYAVVENLLADGAIRLTVQVGGAS